MLIKESQIDKSLREMSEREIFCGQASQSAAEAEHAYKIAFAQEILKAEGTEAVKKATATVKTSKEFLDYLKKKAESDFAWEKLRDARQTVSARQSILSAEKEADKVHSQTAV